MFIHLEGEDLCGATGASDGDGEQADRAAAGDRNALGGDVAGEHGVYRVAQRIEDAGVFLRNRGIQLPDVRLGDDYEFGERAIGVDADNFYVLADVRFANPALEAFAAGHVHLGRDKIAFLHAGDVFAHGFDDPAKLMSGDERRMNAPLRPLIPLVDMEVGAAY